jgi:cell division protein FtsQ
VTTVERARPAAAGAEPAAPHSYRRRRLAVAALVLLVVLGLGWVVTVSPLLSIDHVVVRGTERLRAAQVSAAGGVHEGDSLVWFRAGRAAAAIRTLPYVDHATVTRQWPHTVRVVVSERTPVAWFRRGDATFTTDATGRVLARIAAAPVGVPRLVGVHGTATPGRWITPPSLAAAAGAMPGLARVATETVTAASDGMVTLRLRSGVEVRLGSPDRIDVKVRAALAVLGALAGEHRTVGYVDVSVPTNPVAG